MGFLFFQFPHQLHLWRRQNASQKVAPSLCTAMYLESLYHLSLGLILTVASSITIGYGSFLTLERGTLANIAVMQATSMEMLLIPLIFFLRVGGMCNWPPTQPLFVSSRNALLTNSCSHRPHFFRDFSQSKLQCHLYLFRTKFSVRRLNRPIIDGVLISDPRGRHAATQKWLPKRLT